MPEATLADPIRVLAIATYPQLGGGEVLMVDLLADLADRSDDGSPARIIDPVVLVFGPGAIADRARRRALPVLVAPELHLSSPTSIVAAVRSARRQLRGVSVEVIHASNPKAQLVAWAVSPRRRVGRTVQLLDPPMPGDRYVTATRRLPAARTAITETSAAAWRAALGQPVSLIEPGVDATALRRRAAAGDRNAAWAGLAGAGRVAMVARHQRYKGGADLIDAVALIEPDRRPAVAILGPDEPLEPGWRVELSARAARLGVSDWVAVHGMGSEEDVAATMAAADLLVHPSRHETFGLVVAEALALGTPVVAAASAGPRDVLSHGGGRLVPVGDVTALATAIDVLLCERDELAALADATVAAAARFDRRGMLDAYLELFRRAARSG